MPRIKTLSAPGLKTRHAAAIALLLPLLGGCSILADSSLDAIKRSGEIRVLTYTGTTTYYETPDGAAGFEYDLAKAFADHLGVKLRIVVADRYADVMPRLLDGEADFAAAAIPDTASRRALVRFTPPYQHVSQQVVYRAGSLRPSKLEDLANREIEVQEGSRYAERLQELKQQHRDLRWLETPDRRPEEHLELVWDGLLDLTIADSNIVALSRPYYPELQVAFDIQKPEPLAWAFRPSRDSSLYDAAVQFLDSYRKSGALAQLLDRYYGPAGRSDFVNLTVFRARVFNRLPLYQHMIADAAEQNDLDWRLLAAVAYQESHWDPKSVSFTGVRGFMMLTSATAADLGVLDRHDPQESIEGGARYLRDLLDRLPERIQYPDRLWFGLAAYNVGLAHLEDARILTQKLGGNPDKWNDVKQRLPLLSEPKWYEQTKYGYCRGYEPVQFVSHVREYYDALTKIDDIEKSKHAVLALRLRAPAI
ncbi:MAG: membrane-bound lytic murein transglycosylase MltF [Sulfurifustaceae bacterium]